MRRMYSERDNRNDWRRPIDDGQSTSWASGETTTLPRRGPLLVERDQIGRQQLSHLERELIEADRVCARQPRPRSWRTHIRHEGSAPRRPSGRHERRGRHRCARTSSSKPPLERP